MYCPNCGQQIPDGSEFCGFCGAKIVLPDFSITAAPDKVIISSSQNTQYNIPRTSVMNMPCIPSTAPTGLHNTSNLNIPKTKRSLFIVFSAIAALFIIAAVYGGYNYKTQLKTLKLSTSLQLKNT